MAAYYNEIDPIAAAWLRELIKAGLIAPGDVDERSIEDVVPSELTGYTQCHFFAGIGVWSYALRRAGWPDDRPVWTGSCPCQPFSAAGKGGGFADERHLWPAFYHLVSQCRPVTVFGEQVASKDGLAWLDLVHADLEGAGYTVGAVDTCAAGFGAPHIRQRLYWVADAGGTTCQWDTGTVLGTQTQGSGKRFINGLMPERLADGGSNGELADAEGPREQREFRDHCGQTGTNRCVSNQEYDQSGAISSLADAQRRTAERHGQPVGGAATGVPCKEQQRERVWLDARDGDSTTGSTGRPGPTNGFWRVADWLFCQDGKWRAVESGTFPLVDGAPARVGRLRGYGNAIVAVQAEAFIRAYLDVNG